MQVIKDYRNDTKLRTSFNELAGKTFGLNFEDWYQNGYWTDRYNPHSIVIDGKVAAAMVLSVKRNTINKRIVNKKL